MRKLALPVWPVPPALPLALPASALEGLAKAPHPAAKAAAKAANQAPAKHEASRKRSCGAGKPACMRANGGENASLRKGAPTLALLRDGPSYQAKPTCSHNF